MTRGEEIVKEAELCASANTQIIGDWGEHYLGFIHGAEWADEHPHWISVDELPKIGKDVLVLREDGEMQVAHQYNEEIARWWSVDGFPLKNNITHWMPLPEAPLVTDLNKEDLPPLSCQEGNILVEEEENDMKATDLMLGDLVIHGFGEAGRITEICQNSVVIKANSFDVGDGMNEVSFAINELNPIPLTAEILAKNFNSTEIPDDPYGAYFYESDEYIEVYIKEYTDGLWGVEVDEIKFSSLPTWKMYVSNVHQLQHALRLCNISKKIEL